jgi:hypothetical protein
MLAILISTNYRLETTLLFYFDRVKLWHCNTQIPEKYDENLHSNLKFRWRIKKSSLPNMADIISKPHSQKDMKSILTLGFIGSMLMNCLDPSMVFAQTFDFGTSRKLRICPSRTAPTKGRTNVEQAKQYVACYYEDKAPFNASVQFVDVLSLEIAPKT